jgi:hypothetical protein
MNLLLLKLVTAAACISLASAAHTAYPLFALQRDSDIERVLQMVEQLLLEEHHDPAAIAQLVVQNQRLGDAAIARVIERLNEEAMYDPMPALALLRRAHPGYARAERALRN